MPIMIIQRRLNLRALLEKKSFFLLGPRATGKSFVIREQLADAALVFDLLRSDVYLYLSDAPVVLEGMIEAECTKRGGRVQWIVIDEVQKIPMLLDEVHRLIENKGYTFLLTGSSARKLKHGQSNLLAGRAWQAELFPLSWCELERFDLDRYLRFGGLPAVALGAQPQEELHAYVHTYLYEEIQSEALVRKLPNFVRFLKTAALCSGQMLNFANIASDVQLPASTVREYYGILNDTLLGFLLEGWTESRKRKAISTGKFYLFDMGVRHTLMGTETLDRNSDLYGQSFEQWMAMELRAALSYLRVHKPLSYWRTGQGQEVDFVIGRDVAIEVKATQKVNTRDAKGLIALQEEKIIKNFFLISQDPIERTVQGIHMLHWQSFMKLLWEGAVFS